MHSSDDDDGGEVVFGVAVEEPDLHVNDEHDVHRMLVMASC